KAICSTPLQHAGTDRPLRSWLMPCLPIMARSRQGRCKPATLARKTGGAGQFAPMPDIPVSAGRTRRRWQYKQLRFSNAVRVQTVIDTLHAEEFLRGTLARKRHEARS